MSIPRVCGPVVGKHRTQFMGGTIYSVPRNPRLFAAFGMHELQTKRGHWHLAGN
jgi:hypothetical protein